MKFNQNLIRAYERRRMRDKEQKEKIARQSRDGKAEEEKTRLPGRRNYDSGGGQAGTKWKGRVDKTDPNRQFVDKQQGSEQTEKEREKEGGEGQKRKINSIQFLTQDTHRLEAELKHAEYVTGNWFCFRAAQKWNLSDTQGKGGRQRGREGRLISWAGKG